MSVLPIETSVRQKRDFKAGLDQWVRDTISGTRKPTSNVVTELSRAIEVVQGELPERSIYCQLDELSYRGLSAGTQNSGGELIGIELSEIQKQLRPFSSLVAAGAQIEQYTGNLSVRRETNFATASFLAETDTVVETTTETFGAATALPHRESVLFSYTRQLNLQVPDLGAFVQDTATRSLATGWDRGGLQGAGITGEVTGLFNTAGTQQVVFSATATLANAASFLFNCSNNNAVDENIRFISSPTVRQKWCTIQRWSGASSALWNDDDTILGRKAAVTTNCPTNSICAGDFTLCKIILWGASAITLDPYSQKRSEKWEVTVTQLCDIIFVYPAAFCVSSGSAAQ